MPALRLQERVQELFFEVAHSGGARTSVLVSAVLERDGNGTPQSVLLVLFEAGQRRQYEKELLAKRKQFEQIAEIIDRSADAILRLSSNLIIESWNDGAKEIFGYTHSEVKGQPFGKLLVPEVADEIAAQVDRQGMIADIIMETSASRKDGGSVDVSMRLTPHIEPPGRNVGFSVILRDITSKKIAERALLQADKLASVERLATSISHELNNPLAAVTNLLYLLQTGAKDDETRFLAEAAQSELARVSHLATHTLRFHRQATRKSKIDLSVLFHELISLYEGRFAGAGITATVDTKGTPPLVCYEGELRQILVNLMSNSFDAMRHGGRLLLRSRQVTNGPAEQRSVLISVVDDGTGLAPEACRHLFEPFFSTKGINGAGLGLWISKDLVERHGGTIRIRSSARPGSHGTIVSIRIPMRDALD